MKTISYPVSGVEEKVDEFVKNQNVLNSNHIKLFSIRLKNLITEISYHRTKLMDLFTPLKSFTPFIQIFW